MQIRFAAATDAPALAGIYNFYIENSHSTFEIREVSISEMEGRLMKTQESGYPFFVAVHEDEIVGYAYGSPFRPREAYRHSVEVSVYIRNGNEGQGIGTRLYEVLLDKLLDLGFHSIIAGISLPNEASIKLHERFGFEKVAHFHEVGNKFGRWIDVEYWQLIAREQSVNLKRSHSSI